jgi:hypothetical protein
MDQRPFAFWFALFDTINDTLHSGTANNSSLVSALKDLRRVDALRQDPCGILVAPDPDGQGDGVEHPICVYDVEPS